MSARALGLAVAALILSTLAIAPADAALVATRVLQPPDDSGVTATTTMDVTGSSFLMTMTVSEVAGTHCGVLEVRWNSAFADPEPMGICGNAAGSQTVTASGTSIPSDVEVRACDARLADGSVVSTGTCTDWQLLYAGAPTPASTAPAPGHRNAWGPVRARGGAAVGHGVLTRKGGRTSVRLTVTDRRGDATCGWAMVTGGGQHGRSLACNGTRNKTVRLGHAKRVTIMICAGTRHRVDPRTCRGIRLG